MKPCDRERDVLRAVRSTSSGEAHEHLLHCASCREAVEVVRALGRLKATAVPKKLPDPGTIWWRAQLVRKWALEERASEPLTRMERLSQAVAVLIPIAFAAWKWPEVHQALSRAVSEASQVWIFSGASSSALTWIALAVGALCAGALFALQVILCEE